MPGAGASSAPEGPSFSSGSAAGGAGGAVRWPSSSRRITIATHLEVVDTPYPFALAGNPLAWVAIVDQSFAGDVEVSSDGNSSGDWFPV